MFLRGCCMLFDMLFLQCMGWFSEYALAYSLSLSSTVRIIPCRKWNFAFLLLTLSLGLTALYSNIPLSPLDLLAFLFYLFLLITDSALRVFSVTVTCRHKCFTFFKEVYKMPVASLAFATTSSFPFPFFISKFFGCIVWCACPPPLWLPLCSATIVISVYCDHFLAKVQIQFFIFLSLSAIFVTISYAAL